MLSVLSMEGTKLIPKSPLNANVSAIHVRDIVPDIVRIEELEALGERHLGCGHDI